MTPDPATGPATGDAATPRTYVEALMADRQLFWARFCRTAFWAVVTIAVLLVLLDWTLG